MRSIRAGNDYANLCVENHSSCDCTYLHNCFRMACYQTYGGAYQSCTNEVGRLEIMCRADCGIRAI